MKIAYIYPEKLPSKKARAVSVINTACALSKYLDTTLIYEKSGKINCDVKTIQISRKFLINSNKIFNFNLKKVVDDFDYFYVRHLKTAEFLIKNSKRVIFEVHEIFSEQNENVKEIEKFVLKNSCGLVFINDFLKSYTKKKFELTQPLIVIHNGCGFEFEYIKKDFSNIEEIYYIGSFQKWKGVEFLIDAINKTNIKLKIIGGGKQEDEFRGKSNNNIEFLGYKPHNEIKEILKDIKLGVIPNIMISTTKFSTPIKLYEYMMASCLVLAPNTPTIKEIIKDTENGFLFEIGNEESFLEKLNYILSLNEDTLTKIAKNAYESIKNYTWNNRAKEITNFIKELDDNFPSS